MKKEGILALFLVFCLSSSLLVLVEAETQKEYVMPLEGPTWNHSILSVLVVPQYDEPWWNPGYLNSALRAISQWNGAISYFRANYSEFAYLSRLRMVPQVSNVTIGGFDAYVSWIDQFGNETCEAGLTRTTYTSSNVIVNSTLAFSGRDCLGNILSEVDMQNVALHELGHCLGLGHPNTPEDLMYYTYSLSSPAKAISTLDVYGVGTVFRWMASSQFYNSTNQGAPVYTVTLPSSIQYEYLPITEENRPPESSLGQVVNFLSELTTVVLQPEILALIFLAIAALIAFVTISRIRRRRTVPQQSEVST